MISSSLPTIPGHASAAVLSAYGADPIVMEFPLTAPADGECLVKIECATICGSDCHAWLGHLASYGAVLPVILGHEAVGTIVRLGSGHQVDAEGKQLQLGDRIIWTHGSCGHCRMCVEEYAPSLCRTRSVGFHTNVSARPHLRATFAEYAYTWTGSTRIRVPEDVKNSWAAAASCALRTVFAAVERLGEIREKDDVLVQGAGPLGLFATAVMATRSPRSITVIGGPKERLQLAAAWGASATIDIADAREIAARQDLVREHTGGRGPSIILEMAGVPGAFSEGLMQADYQARYVISGTVSGDSQSVPVQLIAQKNLDILGSVRAEGRHYIAALNFLSTYSARFDWDLMFGKTYGLARLAEGLRAMKSQSEIKGVVLPHLPINQGELA